MISNLQLDVTNTLFQSPPGPPKTLLTRVLHCAKTPWPRNRSRPQRQRNADDVEATTRELEKSRQKGLIWQGKYNFRSVLIHFPYLLHIEFLNDLFSISKVGWAPWNLSCLEFKFDDTRLSYWHKNKIGRIEKKFCCVMTLLVFCPVGCLSKTEKADRAEN